MLGDSHIRRLDQAKLQQIKLAGVGGLRSGNILTAHNAVINDKIKMVDEVIIPIGGNDIAKEISQKTLISNIDNNGKNQEKEFKAENHLFIHLSSKVQSIIKH